MGMKKRILLVDNHDIVRIGLQWLLERQDGFEIAGQAGDGLEAIRLTRETSPDLVVLEACMPGLNGIDAAREIKKQAAGVKIVFVSMSDRKQYVLDSLAAGASGYVLKTRVVDELMPAVRAALQGDIYLSPPVVKYVARSTPHVGRLILDQDGSELSPRERQVLQLVAEGKSSKQIAYALKVEASTVVVHRRNIMNKLQLRSVAELTRYAILNGITPLELQPT